MMRILLRGALLGALAAFSLIAPCRAIAQAEATLLIVSQSSGAGGESGFVDLAPFLVRDLDASHKYRSTIYRRDLPAVQAALDDKRLSQSELTPPFSRDTLHKLADSLGANYVLQVSARNEKDGLFTKATLEARAGQRAWNILFDQKLDATRVKSKKSSVLAGINAHVEALVGLLTNVPARSVASPPPSQPAPMGAGPANGKTPDVKAPTPPMGAGANSATAGKADGSPARPAANAPSANELLVEQFRRQGDQANLIVSLRRAVNDKPRDARLRRELIQAYAERGWQDSALDEARRAVALAPADPSLQRLLGESLLASGDNAEAIKAFAEAVRLDGKNAVNLVALGDAYWNTAQPDEAQKTYAAAAQADPQNPLPHRRLARLYVQRGRLADCAAEMKAAQGLSPQDGDEGYRDDYVALLRFAESDMTDLLAKMQTLRRSAMDGTRTREEAFKALQDQKKRAEAIAAFLDDLPKVPELGNVRASYSQAANLIAQADESAMQFLETQETSRNEETDTYRFEAKNQLGDAAKQLKALTNRKPPQ